MSVIETIASCVHTPLMMRQQICLLWNSNAHDEVWFWFLKTGDVNYIMLIKLYSRKCSKDSIKMQSKWHCAWSRVARHSGFTPLLIPVYSKRIVKLQFSLCKELGGLMRKMSQSPRISLPDSFDQLYNCTFCKAIKLKNLQPDIKDPCQRKILHNKYEHAYKY